MSIVKTRRSGPSTMSSKYYRRAMSPAPDTSDAIAWRAKDALICAQVDAERADRFPVISAENVGDALAWQAARILELHEES